MIEVKEERYPESHKAEGRSKLVSLFCFIVLLAACFYFYSATVNDKKEQISQLNSEKAKKAALLAKVIEDYNKEDAYQKIRLNENGQIEYYDIKVKQNPPSISATEGVGLDFRETVDNKKTLPESKLSQINLESHFNTEITPNFYADINYVLKHTSDQKFKDEVNKMMKDGKISNGEYSEISITLALLTQQIELKKAKDALNKTLK